MRLSDLALVTFASTSHTLTSAFVTSNVNRKVDFQPLNSFSDGSSDEGDSVLFGAKVQGMPDKPPKAPPVDEDNPMGGQLFRKMMEKAKQGPSRPQPSQNAAPTSPQYSQAPVISEQQTTAPFSAPQVPAVDPIQIYNQQLQVWQAQMTAYAQMTASNPAVAAQMQPPPMPQFNPNPVIPQTTSVAPIQAPVSVEPTPSIPIVPKDVDPSQLNPADFLPKASNNRDAYEISNPADVYFAQLKRDSTVRSLARRSGDLETANTPFADAGVQALKGFLSPELIEKRREQLAKNGGEFETSRDEMILPFADSDDVVDKSYTGVSYRKKLEERMKKKGNKTNVAPTSTSSYDTTVQEQPKEQTISNASPVTDSIPRENKVENENQFSLSNTASAPTSVPPTSMAEQKNVELEQAQNFALKVKEDREVVPISAPSMQDSEEARKEIRKLMGLLLKHRGGSGFGHGRLKEAEFKMLEESTSKILSMLKTESGVNPVAPPSMDTTIANAESAIADGHASTSHASTSDSSLAGAIACAEAALALFKASDPSNQRDLLPSVRDALVSATATIRKIVDDNDGDQATLEPEKPVYATSMAFPETYKVTQPDPVEEAVANVQETQTTALPEEFKVAESKATSVPMSGKNAQVLQNAYDALKSIAGDEKYGLRDIRPSEVSSIKDILLDMRTVLMDELDNGIES
jgi:hypothetical protein